MRYCGNSELEGSQLNLTDPLGQALESNLVEAPIDLPVKLDKCRIINNWSIRLPSLSGPKLALGQPRN